MTVFNKWTGYDVDGNHSWKVLEVSFDHDCHEFYVYSTADDENDNAYYFVGSITPSDVDSVAEVRNEFNAGESPDGMEDGMGSVINLAVSDRRVDNAI